MSLPNRGEIWSADLNPIRGHEQAGQRPVLIISTNIFNHGPADLVMILPLTRTNRRIPLHVPVLPPEGGLSDPRYILCDAVRSIAKERLGPQPWGKLTPATLERVDEILRLLLEL
jgi:mRNA interferase MazF